MPVTHVHVPFAMYGVSSQGELMEVLFHITSCVGASVSLTLRSIPGAAYTIKAYTLVQEVQLGGSLVQAYCG